MELAESVPVLGNKHCRNASSLKLGALPTALLCNASLSADLAGTTRATWHRIDLSNVAIEVVVLCDLVEVLLLQFRCARLHILSIDV